ncbi:excalibur calcium-binding domain-containing protein [Streptomyces sp. MUM 178J]|uniref:excalibur calcium-binding domain-containing protein n=1 Tax=Streptomyces sp. MUM 178J TaxID=2791991 RepID=UPI001F0425E4|nr:excalibur calcium-binding domain-containing protein [Streptomyces sp. MUM 178J]WRQ82705.1 excalibur calcium-binding domain-containing protein [Streptomyces sp. MUM 178J]
MERASAVTAQWDCHAMARRCGALPGGDRTVDALPSCGAASCARRDRERVRAGAHRPLAALRELRRRTGRGAAPLLRGRPGYAPRLDADDDGIGCEREK